MKSLFTLTIVSALMAGSAFAEKFVLDRKGYDRPSGTVFLNKSNVNSTEGQLTVTFNGEEANGVFSAVQTQDSKTEYVSKDILIVTINADTSVYKAVMDDEKHNKDQHTKSSIVNLPLTYQRVNGDWVIRDLDILNEEQRRDAEKIRKKIAHTRELSMYGYEARSVGDEWEIKGEALNAMMPLDHPANEAKGVIKLLSVEKIDDVNIATMNVTFELSGKVLGEMQMKVKGELKVVRNIDDFFDTNSNGTMSMTMNSDVGGRTTAVVTDMTITESNKIQIKR